MEEETAIDEDSWTGERLGAAKATSQTEDFKKLEAETEKRREGFEKLYEAAELTHAYLSKKKPSPGDGKTKSMPLESLGHCWEEFSNNIKDGYMETLEVGLKEFKEYSAMKRKLESRRLDYDAKLSRLRGAKKEKPEWEQEMQASKIKYEETERDLIEKMGLLQEYEEEHRNALHQFLEAQFSYHSRSSELLNEVRTKLVAHSSMSTDYTPDQNLSSDTLGKVDDAMSIKSAGLTTVARSAPQPLAANLDSPPSLDKQSTEVTQSSKGSGGTPSPNSTISKHQDSALATGAAGEKIYRKALYGFNGENANELSFRAEDLLTVIEKLDEGWWVGEIEEQGSTRRGIFPVNYTEEFTVSAL
ncbi:hypothetical protein DFQ30_003468 [Apophysomyces sp. BC1015]|nr:hypothetical protein DFQ30_003468 [Apophysomyces sp. BC1015]